MPYAAAATGTPLCPQCQGEMYDNRASKKNPKSPDFRCKDKTCLDQTGMVTALWEKDMIKKGGVVPRQAPPRTARPAPERRDYSIGGPLPYEGPDEYPVAEETTVTPRLDALFALYSACLDHVLAVEVPKLVREKIGASPESVSAMTSTLLIQASKLQ